MENVTSKSCAVIKVEGKGNKKNEAFANALNQIHSQVLKDKDDVIVRIEPQSIEVLKAEEEFFIEKFFFFFFPRNRAEYRVVLNVTVEITMVEVEKIAFVPNRISDPNGIPLNFFKKTNLEKEAK